MEGGGRNLIPRSAQTSHRGDKYLSPTDKFNPKISQRLIIISQWEFFGLDLSVSGRYFLKSVGGLSSQWDVITPSKCIPVFYLVYNAIV